MIKILNDLCASKEMACFYSNYNNTENFNVGVVLAVNEREIALQLISPDGNDDGILVTDVDDIFRVERNGLYMEKIKKLCTDFSLSDVRDQIDENKIFESILSAASVAKEIVSLELVNSGIYDVDGFVEAVDEGGCTIKQIDEYGYEDGYSYVEIDNITQLAYSREEEKRILKLWNLNKSL